MRKRKPSAVTTSSPDAPRNTILEGDALSVLRSLPSRSVQCVISSPPYYGLRNYNVEGQYGLEPTLDGYLDRMVAVFDEVFRVLRPDGVCWLNIGDSYANDDKWGGATSGKHVQGLHGDTSIGRERHHTGLPPKSLMLTPFRLAIALQEAGWTVRQTIIWDKPNCFPQSVTDRPTTSHEYVFLLTRGERYYYDATAIAEPAKVGANGSLFTIGKTAAAHPHMSQKPREERETRNRRSVWTVNTEAFPDAHYAVFPPALITPMVLAGSRPGDLVLDPFIGSGTTAVVAARYGRDYLGIELSPTYAAMARKRVAEEGTAPVIIKRSERKKQEQSGVAQLRLLAGEAS